MRKTTWFLVSLLQFFLFFAAEKIVVAEVRNSQRMNDPPVNIWITESVHRNYLVGKYSGNC